MESKDSEVNEPDISQNENTSTLDKDNQEDHENKEEISTNNDNKEQNDVENNKNDKENKEDDDKTANKGNKEDEDEILKLFFDEINTIDKLGKIEYDNKNISLNPNQIILRLISQNFATPYQILQLKHDATEEEIKQRYYKLSLLIHPDKCQNEKAPQAFQILKDAYNEIKKVDIREKYKEIYEDAKKIVYRRNNLKLDVTQLELYSMGKNINLNKFESEIEKECQNILNKQKERREYAESCINNNIKYEQKIQQNLMDLEKEKLYHKIEWDKYRDNRVNSWKKFQEKNNTKLVTNISKYNITKKENRNENINLNTKNISELQSDRLNKRKKIVNNDELLYKQNWK